jgi:hypothetical protein
MAAMTGVSPNTASVRTAYTNVRQSLPAVTDINAFLSSHQTSIAQLAITYCSALVDNTTARASYFSGLNFSSDITSAGQRAALIDPLIDRMFGAVATQPADADVRGELDQLVTTLCGGGSCSSGARTPTVAKAVCGAAIGNAAMLVQ